MITCHASYPKFWLSLWGSLKSEVMPFEVHIPFSAAKSSKWELILGPSPAKHGTGDKLCYCTWNPISIATSLKTQKLSSVNGRIYPVESRWQRKKKWQHHLHKATVHWKQVYTKIDNRTTIYSSNLWAKCKNYKYITRQTMRSSTNSKTSTCHVALFQYLTMLQVAQTHPRLLVSCQN